MLTIMFIFVVVVCSVMKRETVDQTQRNATNIDKSETSVTSMSTKTRDLHGDGDIGNSTG